MQNRRPDVRIVLVRPRNPLNLLAATRAAANFDINDVAVVAPYEPTWQEARASRGAGKWLRQARRVATLLEAIEDRTWVLGTSCLSRRQLEPSRILSLESLPSQLRRSGGRRRIAIVFGSEKRGLSNQDLELCHSILYIPTAADTPSMNLGQAVAVCCYEVCRATASAREAAGRPSQRATVGEVLLLVEALGELLHDTESQRGKDRKRLARLRRTLLQLGPTSPDVALGLGILRDLAWKLRKGSGSFSQM